ncbi:MAG: lamin tail domain-containing protein, partial [Candidatus Bipolaricaulota bacterium]
DCDDDGLPDPEDPCPLDPDCDDDGLPDPEDPCPLDPDCDDDGLPDPEDPCPLDPDCDDDGLPDPDDPCPTDPDCDDDGIPDPDDPCPTDPDCDDDGIPDPDDPCPTDPDRSCSAIGDPRALVISEVAWAGTMASPEHQWIELYNRSDAPVALDGCVLLLQSSEGSRRLTLMVALQGTVPAKGYFLLEQETDDAVRDLDADQVYSGLLLGGGGTVSLIGPDGIVLDTANHDGGPWCAGMRSGSLAVSMERKSPDLPDEDENWSSNDTVHRNGEDAGGNPINGTPKEACEATP